MRTYYWRLIDNFCWTCELNTNQKKDLQPQSTFFQVWLLVSLVFLVCLVHFCSQYLLSNDQRNKLNVQNPSICKKVHDFRLGVRKLGFQTVDPNLSRQSLTKCGCSRTVKCLQISLHAGLLLWSRLYCLYLTSVGMKRNLKLLMSSSC